MSKAEANVLIDWGKQWFAHMWISDNVAKRDELIRHINGQLNGIGFNIQRGWMNYDPVIRRANRKPSSYAEIAAWASRQDGNGRCVAQSLLNWATDDTTGLLSLQTELQDLAIITHLAEVARGRSSSLGNELYPLLRAIEAGIKSWGDYHEYSPSLKYADDSKMDWSQ